MRAKLSSADTNSGEKRISRVGISCDDYFGARPDWEATLKVSVSGLPRNAKLTQRHLPTKPSNGVSFLGRAIQRPPMLDFIHPQSNIHKRNDALNTELNTIRTESSPESSDQHLHHLLARYLIKTRENRDHLRQEIGRVRGRISEQTEQVQYEVASKSDHSSLSQKLPSRRDVIRISR